MLLIQLGIMVWTLRRLRELSHIRERMSRLADGLALLTDTTEAGLSTLIKEVQQFAPQTAGAAIGVAQRGRQARRHRGPQGRRPRAHRRARSAVGERSAAAPQGRWRRRARLDIESAGAD